MSDFISSSVHIVSSTSSNNTSVLIFVHHAADNMGLFECKYLLYEVEYLHNKNNVTSTLICVYCFFIIAQPLG